MVYQPPFGNLILGCSWICVCASHLWCSILEASSTTAFHGYIQLGLESKSELELKLELELDLKSELKLELELSQISSWG